MKRTLCLCLLLLGFVACRKHEIQVTITYDKNTENNYPYKSYADVAQIYYTIGAQHFTKEVTNHHSIQLAIPERTQMRASYGVFIMGPNGTSNTSENAFYTVDKNNPDWKF